MSADTTPRLFIAQAELTERRPVLVTELAEFQKRARLGLLKAASAIGAVVVLYVLFGIALNLAPLRLEVLGLILFLITILALALVVLFVRDGIATYRRYRSMGPEAEILLFHHREEAERPLFTVVSPGNLLVRVLDQWMAPPVVVEPAEVAPPSSRTESVADWLLEQDDEYATRLLEPDERRELERFVQHRRLKMRWWEWLYLAWAVFAIASIIAGPARSQTTTFLRAALVLYVGWSVVARLLYIHRIRRDVKQALSVGMVRLTMWQPDDEEEEQLVVETLLPDDIPWSMGGQPAPWRAS